VGRDLMSLSRHQFEPTVISLTVQRKQKQPDSFVVCVTAAVIFIFCSTTYSRDTHEILAGLEKFK
jgi:hypothetical protein